MFAKINPIGMILAHFKTLKNYDSGRMSKSELLLHLIFPALCSYIHFKWGAPLTEGVVSILVSAASIFAGLMLNLLVLIYTLVYNGKQNSAAISNFSDFLILCKETLSTISYSVLLCIILVVFCFLSLSTIDFLIELGQLGVVYLSVSAMLCLLIVLKRCYTIIQYDLK
nr:hypothetical protein [uncultured Albidiferax sp.]